MNGSVERWVAPSVLTIASAFRCSTLEYITYYVILEKARMGEGNICRQGN
jgi:hypothetical protein